MRFITSTFFAVAALAGLVMAGENPIIYPDGSSKIVAGTPFVITWTPTTGGTVTLTLRQGASDNLDDVKVIAAGTENDGTYEWTPEKTLPAGSNYAIMITDSKGNVNYTPLIAIQSDAAPSVKSSTSTKASSTVSASSTSSASSTKVSASATKVSASATTELSSPVTTSAAMTHGYTNTTMITSAISSYANATSTGNLTRSSTHSSSAPTSTEETGTTGAASSLLKSPLALVVCVLGAVLYLN